jgi:hypothetical protein
VEPPGQFCQIPTRSQNSFLNPITFFKAPSDRWDSVHVRSRGGTEGIACVCPMLLSAITIGGFLEFKEVALGANYMRMGSTESYPEWMGGGGSVAYLQYQHHVYSRVPRERLAARLDYNSLLRTLFVSLGAYRESGTMPGRAGTGRDSGTRTRTRTRTRSLTSLSQPLVAPFASLA